MGLSSDSDSDSSSENESDDSDESSDNQSSSSEEEKSSAQSTEIKSASRIANQLSGSSQIQATNNQVKDENRILTFNQEKYGNNPLLDPDFKLNISWANDIITWDQ